MKIAEQYEQVGQRKLPARTVRETLAELYREIYNDSLPSATVRQFIENWLKTKQPEVSPTTLAFYAKSTAKFLQFLGPAAELDLASVTRTALVEFRNQVAQKASGTTTNHDLKAIKAVFREAKRDGYIVEDPSEFVDTVRKSSADSRRPFTVPEIQSVLGVADPEWRSMILFGLYSGQRLADVASLTWDNVDLETRSACEVEKLRSGFWFRSPSPSGSILRLCGRVIIPEAQFILKRLLPSIGKGDPAI